MKNYSILKKNLSIFIIILCFTTLQGQESELWGISRYDGQYEEGTIYKTNGDGDEFEIILEFERTIGGAVNGLIEASNGKLYGVSSQGGENSNGILFEFDPTTSSYNVLYNFHGFGARHPTGDLVETSNGIIYGTAHSVDYDTKYGVIFEYNYYTNELTIRYEINDESLGRNPFALNLAPNGKLYGLSYGSAGHIFEYDIQSQSYVKIFSFGLQATNSMEPTTLVLAPNNKFYGTTYTGGDNNAGVIFEYDYNTNTYTNKVHFSGTYVDPQYLIDHGRMILASNGKLYGTKQNIVPNQPYSDNTRSFFEYSYDTDEFVIKMDDTPFQNFQNGPEDKIYGTAHDSSLGHYIYEYDYMLNSHIVKKELENFYVGGTPILITSNDLFYFPGTRYYPAEPAEHYIYQYDLSSDILHDVVKIGRAEKGRMPDGKLLNATNGMLYGITNSGGYYENGILFEINPVTNEFDIKYEFDNELDGKNPYGNLIQASDGSIYGQTKFGGVNGDGVIFEYDIETNSYQKNYEFGGNNLPNSRLSIEATNGKLYGICQIDYNNAFICEYNYESDTLLNKVTLNQNVNGTYYNPYLIEASNGKLYGTSRYGGWNDKGVLFEYDYVNNIYTKKIDFDGINTGEHPHTGVAEASAGILYGTASNGGLNGDGTIFEYNFITETFVKKFDFAHAISGSSPLSQILISSNNKLYGITENGGNNNGGVLYEFDINTETFVKKVDFQNNWTSHIELGLIEIETSQLNIDENSIDKFKIFPNPVKNTLTIESKSNTSFEIINLEGKILHYGNFKIGVNLIDVSNFSKGLYLLKIIDETIMVTKKIIKI